MMEVNENDVMESEEVIAKLIDLAALEFNAIETYEAAIERLDNLDCRAKMTEFLGEHERHLMQLCDAIIEQGGTPPDGGDYKQFLTKGPVVIAGIGGDKAILQAMLLNESLTNKLYENANEEIFPGYIQLMLKQALGDVRHHKVWIESAIEQY
jgi:rubrerythrin